MTSLKYGMEGSSEQHAGRSLPSVLVRAMSERIQEIWSGRPGKLTCPRIACRDSIPSSLGSPLGPPLEVPVVKSYSSRSPASCCPRKRTGDK